MHEHAEAADDRDPPKVEDVRVFPQNHIPRSPVGGVLGTASPVATGSSPVRRQPHEWAPMLSTHRTKHLDIAALLWERSTWLGAESLPWNRLWRASPMWCWTGSPPTLKIGAQCSSDEHPPRIGRRQE